MNDIPKMKYPDFHDALVRDVVAKNDATTARIGIVLEITPAREAKDAARARLTAFNRGDLTPPGGLDTSDLSGIDRAT